MEAKLEALAATNVTGMKSTTPPRDRTGAERQRRWRERRKGHLQILYGRKRKSSARAVTVPSTTAPLPPHRRRSIVPALTLLAALGVAAVSGAFSIVGLVAVFAASFWPIVGMGTALELAKLSAVAWLGRRYAASRWLKVAITGLVVTLMGLNAVGAYGYLAHAHIDHTVTAEAAIDAKAAGVNAHRQVAQAAVDDIDRRIAQVDAAVAEATRRGRTSAAMALVDHETARRGELVADRARAADALATIQVEEAGVENERAEQAADFGPVEYLSKLIGADREAVLRWFIVLVAALLDPLAITLLWAANAGE